MTRTVMTLFLLGFMITAASAETPTKEKEEEQEYYYQWVDEDGVRHIVDEEHLVPESQRDKAQKIIKDSADPTISGPDYEGIRSGERTRLRKERNKEWRKAFFEIRHIRARLQKALEKQEKILAACPVYDAIDPQRNHLAVQCRETAEKEIARLKKELGKTDALILETKEKGRRAGIPPGTFRD